MKRSIYDEDHEAFRASIREFIAKEVTPNFAKWEVVGNPPRDLFRKLGELGAMGFGIPEAYDHPGTPPRLAALAETARELGATVNQVVLAWLLGGETPVLPIVGASRVEQIEEVMGALAVTLDPEQRRRLDEAGA